ncbi:MAG: oxygen-independent coproporphyrinogen III oxidase [Woeseiaceae bacterium]
MTNVPAQPGVSPAIDFDQELVERYGGRGPRYTSYPTALQFSERLTESDYRANAIASNASGAPLSLYVHIPFCHALCYYCGCNKIVTRNQVRVERYMEMLHREIGMQSELFDRARKTTQLHFGGGTPTYLDREQMDTLMAALRDAFPFDESDHREFSIEVDPRTVDSDDLRHLSDLGFNRLSLGIQDFDPVVQEAVNRMQSADEVSTLVNTARDTEFKSISFDLIYGLPHQNVKSFDATLDVVINMRPDRLAVYNYAHLPERFKGQRMINAADIPSPETKLDILHHTMDRLADFGYVYIGMDHFALPDDDLVQARHEGTLQRNFQGYSTHGECDLIGLGVSSISSIGNVYAQSAITTMEYEALIEGGHIPIRKGIAVDEDDLIRADVIQALMCYDRLDFDDFDAGHNIEFRDYFKAELERLPALASDGLIDLDTDSITITPKGRLLLRSIAMVFDRHINEVGNEKRFSKAI